MYSEPSKRRPGSSGECFVAARYNEAENGRLSQSPGSRDDAAVLFDQACYKDDKSYQRGQHGSEHDGRAGQGMPQEIATTEDGDDISWKFIKKFDFEVHVNKLVLTWKKAFAIVKTVPLFSRSPLVPKVKTIGLKIVMTKDEVFDLFIAMEAKKENWDDRCQKLFKQNQSLLKL